MKKLIIISIVLLSLSSCKYQKINEEEVFDRLKEQGINCDGATLDKDYFTLFIDLKDTLADHSNEFNKTIKIAVEYCNENKFDTESIFLYVNFEERKSAWLVVSKMNTPFDYKIVNN